MFICKWIIVYASDGIYQNNNISKYSEYSNKNIVIAAIITAIAEYLFIVNYVSILYRSDYLLLNLFSVVIFSIGIIINCNVAIKNKTYSIRAQIGQLVILNIDCYYSLVLVCNNSPISLCIFRKFSPFSVVLNAVSYTHLRAH